jgi:TetR/AcrR family transcriptional regulator, transcriptional repressor for nem operon
LIVNPVYLCIPNGRFMVNSKEHILKTSLMLFLQKSYRDVTMSEIVTKTGLSKGAFYHYFASKEELFREIVAIFFSMGAVNYATFSNETLKSFYRQYIDYLDHSLADMRKLVTDPGDTSFNFNFFLILFEAVGRFPEFLKIEAEFHVRDLDAWKAVVAVARTKGEISSSSSDEDIANLFLFCTDGVFLRFINKQSPATYHDFLSSAFDTIYQNLIK